MRSRLSLPVFAFLLGALSACSSAFIVKSDPLSADVSLQDPKTGEKKNIGKTPLNLPTSDVRKAAGDNVMSGEFFTVIVEKTGYMTEKLLVPAARFGTLVTSIDVKLKSGEKEERLAKNILDHLFLAQKLAVTKQFERAQIELDKILNDAPEFPRALSMRASIYFVQKNYAESLKWYEAALKADPQMEDAVKMTAKIRAVTGGRLPASAPAPTPTPSPSPQPKTGGTP